MRDVMIDIETLGTRPGCIVLSIGAVIFDRKTGETGREFHAKIDPSDCERLGLICEVDTAIWWMEQSDEARAELLDHRCGYDLAYALDAFADWFQSTSVVDAVWSQGQDFDFPILAAAFRAVGSEVIWPHWMQRDTRTAYDVCGFDPKSVPREGTHHSAIDDCLHQIKRLHLALTGSIGGVE